MAEQVSPIGAPHAAQASPAWVGYLIGPVFLLLAAWFVWGPQFTPPRGTIPVFDPALIIPSPPRSILGDPPTINISGFDRTCMDCHRLFPTADDPPARLMQHSHIVVDHGVNKQCRNCHDTADKNRLKIRGIDSISFSQVVRLCADCHGPIYRDWQRGMHGRTNGYWNAERGEVRRLGCTECHDPHNPRSPLMEPMKPLPGPNTLRMGPKRSDRHGADTPERDPLQRALKRMLGGDETHPAKTSDKINVQDDKDDR